MRIADRLATLPQYIAPQRSLSRAAWHLARCRNSFVKSFLIRTFLKCYDVDLEEAERSNPRDYCSFNDFFTRALRPDARDYNRSDPVILSPSDGSVSRIGRIDADNILQAKGRYYTLSALLAQDFALAERFNWGEFATIYLAPNNYHRVHAPVSGRIVGVRYVPGKLFSVNQRTARSIDKLFAANERLILEVDSECGKLALILVGAMLVSSMELRCCDIANAVNEAHDRRCPVAVELGAGPRELIRGEELGRFNMGSTVIVLAEPGRINWSPELMHGSEVRVGQTIGRITPRD